MLAGGEAPPNAPAAAIPMRGRDAGRWRAGRPAGLKPDGRGRGSRRGVVGRGGLGCVEGGGNQGGWMGEDRGLIGRNDRRMRERGRPCRIQFGPDPICYTLAPESDEVLGKQRDRWQRGLADSLWRHRRMILNPRYGVVGLFTMPVFVLFELLSPFVELFGYVWTLVAVAQGRVDVVVGVLFFVVAFLLGMLFSFQAMLMDEATFKLYPDLRSRLTLIASAVVENFGYRQFVLYSRAKGLVQFVRGAK